MDQPHQTLVLTTRRNGSVPVVSLEGEFDLDGMDRFQRTVHDILADRPPAIDVDARELDFIDSSGLRALLIARQHAEAAGTKLRLVKISGPVERILAMTGLSDLLGCTFGSTDSASSENERRAPATT